MNNATDKFFEEMLAAAKRKAKKEVNEETRAKLAIVVHIKKQLAAAKKEIVALRKPENVIVKRERAVATREQALEYREDDIKLAEKEINYIMDQIDKIRDEKVTVTTTRKFAKGSKVRGYYGRMYQDTKSAALASVRRRAKKESKT